MDPIPGVPFLAVGSILVALGLRRSGSDIADIARRVIYLAVGASLSAWGAFGLLAQVLGTSHFDATLLGAIVAIATGGVVSFSSSAGELRRLGYTRTRTSSNRPMASRLNAAEARKPLGDLVYIEGANLLTARLAFMRVVVILAAIYVIWLSVTRGGTQIGTGGAGTFLGVMALFLMITAGWGRERVHRNGFAPGVMGLHTLVRRRMRKGVRYGEVTHVDVEKLGGSVRALRVETQDGKRYYIGGTGDEFRRWGDDWHEFVVQRCSEAGAAVEVVNLD